MNDEITVNSTKLKLDENGHLLDSDDWSEEFMIAMANSLEIELTAKAKEIIEFMRLSYADGEEMTVRKLAASGIVTIQQLYELFPGGPVKYPARLAGLPKPRNCI